MLTSLKIKNGNTPLHLALEEGNGNLEIFQLLKQNGANLNASSNVGLFVSNLGKIKANVFEKGWRYSTSFSCSQKVAFGDLSVVDTKWGQSACPR